MYIEHTATVMHQHRAQEIARRAELRRRQAESTAARAPRPISEPLAPRHESWLMRVLHWFGPATPTRA